MLLISRDFLRPILYRISGKDGHYTAFRLVFYSGFDPRIVNIVDDTYELAGFNFASPWASPWPFPWEENCVYKKGPLTTTVTASGLAVFWRVIGLHDGKWNALVHGTIGLVGSTADIKVRTLEWMIGDTVTLEAIKIFPIKLTYE